MNDIHKEPLFTSWPTPLSDKDLSDCFKVKKNLKSKTKSKVKLNSFSSFINFYSFSY